MPFFPLSCTWLGLLSYYGLSLHQFQSIAVRAHLRHFVCHFENFESFDSSNCWCSLIFIVLYFFLLVSSGFIGHMLTSKYLLPLNKMANSFLMVYPIVTRVIVLSSDSSVHLSMGFLVCCIVISIQFSFYKRKFEFFVKSNAQWQETKGHTSNFLCVCFIFLLVCLDHIRIGCINSDDCCQFHTLHDLSSAHRRPTTLNLQSKNEIITSHFIHRYKCK